MSRAELLSRLVAVCMFFLPGALSVCVALFRSKWFYERSQSHTMLHALPPKWRRPAYFVLGLLLLGCGLLLWLDPRGVIK